MDSLPMVFSIVAALFSVMASVMMGLILAKVNGIDLHLEKLNGKVFDHITHPDIHQAGFAKTGEQIVNLLQTVKVAHERLDRVESSSS